jgi:hypothetical protein
MGGFENDRRGNARLERFDPARSTEAPAVSRLQANEAKVRHWSRQVVARLLGELEKLGRNPGAYGMDPDVVGPGLTTPAAVETRERFARAFLKVGSKDVLSHGLNVGASVRQAEPDWRIEWRYW